MSGKRSGSDSDDSLPDHYPRKHDSKFKGCKQWARKYDKDKALEAAEQQDTDRVLARVYGPSNAHKRKHSGEPDIVLLKRALAASETRLTQQQQKLQAMTFLYEREKRWNEGHCKQLEDANARVERADQRAEQSAAEAQAYLGRAEYVERKYRELNADYLLMAVPGQCTYCLQLYADGKESWFCDMHSRHPIGRPAQLTSFAGSGSDAGSTSSEEEQARTPTDTSSAHKSDDQK